MFRISAFLCFELLAAYRTGRDMQWQDFDLEGKVKIPVGFYLILAYLMRGYLIWIVSLTYREDTGLLLSLIYPDMRVFTLILLLGLPAVICFILFGLRSQTQKPWFIWCWSKQKTLLLFTLALDLGLQAWTIVQHPTQIHWSQIPLAILGFYLLWYGMKSRRIQRFFRLWSQS